LPAGLIDRTLSDVVEPTLAQMAEDGNRFQGFLYSGLALTAEGPKVLEFNVRLGDPETQAVIPRMTSDLLDVLEGAKPQWSTRATVNVVLAADGYPESPVIGDVIKGADRVSGDVIVFHAGTRRVGRELLVDGGRVLSVVGTGPTVEHARSSAYEAVGSITWPGMKYRNDIGQS